MDWLRLPEKEQRGKHGQCFNRRVDRIGNRDRRARFNSLNRAMSGT